MATYKNALEYKNYYLSLLEKNTNKILRDIQAFVKKNSKTNFTHLCLMVDFAYEVHLGLPLFAILVEDKKAGKLLENQKGNIFKLVNYCKDKKYQKPVQIAKTVKITAQDAKQREQLSGINAYTEVDIIIKFLKSVLKQAKMDYTVFQMKSSYVFYK